MTKKLVSLLMAVIVLAGISIFLTFYPEKINNYKQTLNNDQEQNLGIANPASVNCIEKGGTLMIKENSAGQYGLCYFEDNRACEEWALMRGECPVGGMKTTGYDTEEQRFCAWVGGHTTTNNGDVCTFDDGSTCALEKLYNGECRRGQEK